jgi:hypothetical protein
MKCLNGKYGPFGDKDIRCCYVEGVTKRPFVVHNEDLYNFLSYNEQKIFSDFYHKVQFDSIQFEAQIKLHFQWKKFFSVCRFVCLFVCLFHTNGLNHVSI